ncbi:4'-phosphopantetheinyl transferase [Bifidobacterium aemilianum]|uniref:4'-phosphopantetheinyl transferase n=1 Tax=Bifidobacterium aemilianum TaxID=2493120 RepID=A0A366K8Z5_9BIFI|nr:holo-ACP synthase [Bifidobacterium aemilianum]RBP97638.1 4'-phosphopantetheinyl transferase [Bifidobacterium aemilianum]
MTLVSSLTNLLGLGHDIVDVAAFARQLDQPGSSFGALFSTRELRQADERGRTKGDGRAIHLAAKWAGKESVLKAWCQSLGEESNPYSLDDFPWSQVEILDDSRGRPQVIMSPSVSKALEDSLPSATGATPTPHPSWRLSLTHDGGLASAVALLVVGQ